MDQMRKLMNDMLNHACGSLSDSPGFGPEGNQTELDLFNGGYQEYVIETHCVRFIVSAKADADKPLDDPDRWDIRDWRTEDC